MRKLRPIHPLLFAVLPVFSLYSHNAGELRLADLELPLALTVIASAVLWLLLSLIVRDLVRAALMSSLSGYGSSFSGIFTVRSRQYPPPDLPFPGLWSS